MVLNKEEIFRIKLYFRETNNLKITYEEFREIFYYCKPSLLYDIFHYICLLEFPKVYYEDKICDLLKLSYRIVRPPAIVPLTE